MFKKIPVGEKETVTLKKSNLRKVARRSGQPYADLKLMLELSQMKGQPYKVSYTVVNSR